MSSSLESGQCWSFLTLTCVSRRLNCSFDSCRSRSSQKTPYFNSPLFTRPIPRFCPLRFYPIRERLSHSGPPGRWRTANIDGVLFPDNDLLDEPGHCIINLRLTDYGRLVVAYFLSPPPRPIFCLAAISSEVVHESPSNFQYSSGD